MNIGRLEKVELRKLWKHEEYDFSAWLAQPENLNVLSDEIGISLVDPRVEPGVGKFSADIIAEEESTGRKVLIENQLEATNHDHLGKLFTYGAGLDASILIWIVKRAREEHEQAIDWLNEHTDDTLNLFLIQIEAWQIGNSDPAPKFNIIAKPNDWAKVIRQSTQQSTLSEYNLLQQKFWEGLLDRDSKGLLGSRKARPQHWQNVSFGSSLAHIALTVNKNNNSIGCEIYIPKDADKTIFDKLYTHKDSIEAQIGLPLTWMRLDHRTAARIKTTRKANVLDEEKWDEYYEWLLRTVSEFKKAFSKLL